jgi:glycolate oxidase
LEDKHINHFTNIVGEDNIKSDKAHLLAYSYDATRSRYEPELVIFPKNEQEISQILKYCNENKIVITPRGSGSGFTGGALPADGGIVLSLEKHMNKIIELDTDNMVIVTQPGVINMDLQKFVEEKGFFYPPDPASQDYSSIGGNVSENAGGMRAAKYGITKDYVMALRAVLPNGDIIKAGKRTIKDVAGYNIVGTLVGSEGTLAIITEITLKLIKKPLMNKTSMGIFDNVNDAMNAVYKTMANGVTPVTMEFLDSLTLKAIEKKFNKSFEKAGAILVVDVDGNNERELDEQLKIIEESFKENKVTKFKIAKNKEQSDEIWFARRNASVSLSVYGNKKINEDITVPRSKLPELLEKIAIISKKYDLPIPCFGHTGDGNVHTNVMIKDKNDKELLDRGYKAIKEVFQATIDLEGTLSGEHGIGLSKAEYMTMAFSDEEMNMFKNLKLAFDPNNILNPFKMGLINKDT